MQPSSPYLPCRALNTTSGPPPPAGRRKSISARRSRLTSYSMTSWPPSRRPSAQALPLTSETSRSGDQPPIRTATLRLMLRSGTLRGGGSPTRAARRSCRTRAGALPRPASRCRKRWRRRVLIRKLVCFSETCAPPIFSPRQPARVDQLPRLVAGRIGEGRAAGAAARLGVGARRVDLVDAPRDRELVARRRPEPRRGEDPVGRRRRCGGRKARARAGVTVKILPARSTASAEISTSASSPP